MSNDSMATQHPESIREAAWFLWRNFAWTKELGRDLLRNWLRWHACEGSLAIIRDDDGTLCGVGMARPVMDSEDAEDCYAFDPEGKVLFVDLAVATNRQAFTMLFLVMLHRFGQRPMIAFRRYPDTDIRTYSLERFRRNFLRREMVYGRR